MKFLFSQECRCGADTYDVSVYEGDRIPINSELKIDTSPFVEGEYIEETKSEHIDIENLREKIIAIGPHPSSEEANDVYSLIYDKLVTRQMYHSNYTSEIEHIINSIDALQRTNFEETVTEQQYSTGPIQRRTRTYVFEDSTPPHKPLREEGMRLFVTQVNSGYGCMTTSLVLGVFTDQNECFNFEQKVEDFLKSHKSQPEDDVYWQNCEKQTYVLKNDLKTFRQTSR